MPIQHFLKLSHNRIMKNIKNKVVYVLKNIRYDTLKQYIQTSEIEKTDENRKYNVSYRAIYCKPK